MFNHFHSRYMYIIYTVTCRLFGNSEDSDEMLDYPAFHQGLHCLLTS